MRSANNPVADYAEWLVEKTLNVQLMTKSTTGYDAEDKSGRRYEIKARRITPRGKMTHFSATRGLDKRHFDFIVAVVFNQDFSVKSSALIPYDVVKYLARFRKHVNGWILYIRPDVWSARGVKDITKKLAAEQEWKKR